MTVPNPLIQYANINPWRARCGSKFALQTPQLLPKALADLLACEVCVYPKVADPVVPTIPCFTQFMAAYDRTTLPQTIFLDIESWTSELDGFGNPYIDSVGSMPHFGLEWGIGFGPLSIESWVALSAATSIVVDGSELTMNFAVDCYATNYDELRFFGQQGGWGAAVAFFTYTDATPTYSPEFHLTALHYTSFSGNPIDITFDAKLVSGSSGSVLGTFTFRIYE